MIREIIHSSDSSAHLHGPPQTAAGLLNRFRSVRTLQQTVADNERMNKWLIPFISLHLPPQTLTPMGPTRCLRYRNMPVAALEALAGIVAARDGRSGLAGVSLR